MKGRNINQMLQLKPGERGFVGWGFMLSLLTGLPRLFSMTLGNALFLSNFPAAYLPLVYLGSAVLNPLVGVAYLALEKRVSFRTLQNWSLTLLLIVSGIFAVLLYTAHVSLGLVGLAMLIWLDIEWTVTNLLHWGTFNRISTLDQSKRLYGILGTGEVLMLVLGGLITPVMVQTYGISSLIFFSLGGFLLMIPVLNGLLSRYHVQEPHGFAPEKNSHPPQTTGLYKSFAILLILFFGFFQYGIEFFGDTLFYMGAEQVYGTAEALAEFFAQYFPLLGVLTLVFKLLLSGRILARLGLKVSLLITPIGLMIGGLLVSLINGLPIVIGLRLFQAIFFSGLVYPAFYSLLQPLEPRQRSRIQTLSELVYGPIMGVGLGGALFLLTGLGQVGIQGLGLLVVISSFGWLLLCRSTFIHYTKALDLAMDQGVFSRTPDLLDFQAQQRLAQSLVKDQPNLARLKLEFLEAAGYVDLESLYMTLLNHQDDQIRIRAYQGMGSKVSFWSNETIKHQIDRETQHLGKLVLLGQITSYTNYLEQKDPDTRTPLEHTFVDLKDLFHKPEQLFPLVGSQHAVRDYLLHVPSIQLSRILLELYKPTDQLGSSSFDHPWIQGCSDQEIRRIFRWIEQWLSIHHRVSFEQIRHILQAYTSERLRDNPAQRLFARKLLGVLGRVPGKDHFLTLVESATRLEAGLRGTAISMAFRLAIRNETLVKVGPFPEMNKILWNIRHEYQMLTRFISHIVTSSRFTAIEDVRSQILEGAEEIRLGLVRQLFQTLGLGYSSSVMDSLDRTFRTGRADRQALAVERLETLISSDHWSIIERIFTSITIPLDKLPSQSIHESQDSDTGLEEIPDYGSLGISGSWLGHLLAPDRNLEDQVDAAKALKNLGLFQQVPLSQLWYLAKDGTIHRFSKKTKVIVKGDVGTSLFVPLEGEPEIEKHPKERFTLPVGTVIGEFAALDNEPRSASVYAPKGARWFELSQDVLQDAIQINPELALAILGVISRKAENQHRSSPRLPNSLSTGLLLGPLDTTPGTGNIFLSGIDQKIGFFDRAQILQRLPLFCDLSSEEILSLSSATLQELGKTDSIIWSSESPDLCMLLSGSVEVSLSEPPVSELSRTRPGPVLICPNELMVVGQSKVFQRQIESYQIIARSDVMILRVPTVAIESLIWADPEALFRLASPLVRYIRSSS
jgi:CRP-like cAMP-binding protein